MRTTWFVMAVSGSTMVSFCSLLHYWGIAPTLMNTTVLVSVMVSTVGGIGLIVSTFRRSREP